MIAHVNAWNKYLEGLMAEYEMSSNEALRLVGGKHPQSVFAAGYLARVREEEAGFRNGTQIEPGVTVQGNFGG